MNEEQNVATQTEQVEGQKTYEGCETPELKEE